MTIRSIDPDPRVRQIVPTGLLRWGCRRSATSQVADVVHVRGELSEDDCQKLHGLLVDPLLQQGPWSTPSGRAVEVALLPGVTDTAADAVMAAADMLGLDVATRCDRHARRVPRRASTRHAAHASSNGCW